MYKRLEVEQNSFSGQNDRPIVVLNITVKLEI